MYLKTFEICVLKYMRLLIFFCTRTGMASNLKKTKVKLDLLNDINVINGRKTLREKCPNTELFLVCIFLYSD